MWAGRRQAGTLVFPAGPSVTATRTMESPACSCWSQHGGVQHKGLLSCDTHWAKEIAGLYLHFLLFLSITWETDSISAVEPCYESIVPCPHLHPWALEKCWYKHSESSHNRREVIPEMKNQASHMVSHLSLCISRNFTGKKSPRVGGYLSATAWETSLGRMLETLLRQNFSGQEADACMRAKSDIPEGLIWASSY